MGPRMWDGRRGSENSLNNAGPMCRTRWDQEVVEADNVSIDRKGSESEHGADPVGGGRGQGGR
jgi:hypothetical protein